MKNSLKILCLLLAFVIIVLMGLVSCDNENDDARKEESDMLTLLADGMTDYTLIHSDSASEMVFEAVSNLCSSFTEQFGIAPDMRSDWTKEGEKIPAGTREILIGATNRPESAKAMKALKDESFLIKVYGERIAIVANSDAMLAEALNYFFEDYIASATNKVELSKKLTYIGRACEYAPIIDNGDGTVTLKLKHFVVTYDNANEQIFVPSVAQAFASRASELYGVVGVAEDHNVSKYEVLFGVCDREDYKTTDKEFSFRDYYIGYANNKLSISAFSIYGYERAINFLLEGFDEDGLTIPMEGIYDEYDYGTGRYAEVYKNYENPGLNDAWMVNISHRGDVTTNNNPENSIPAYQSCIDNSVDVIETDLKKTKDGVWIICHDQTIDRTTNGEGAISQMTYEQTQNYFLMTQNGGSGSSKTKHKMPALVEIIDLCKGKVLFNLDHLSPSMFQNVYDIFEEKDAVEMAMFKTDAWSAYDLIDWFCLLLEDGRKLPLFSPQLYSNTLNGAIYFKGLTAMLETGSYHSVETLEHIHDCNIRAMCLTALDFGVESEAYYTKLKDLGYTAIMTDAPILLKEFIHGK